MNDFLFQWLRPETGPVDPVTKAIGPLYGDAFSNELEAFDRHIIDRMRPLTDLADSRRDLALMAEIIERMKAIGGT